MESVFHPGSSLPSPSQSSGNRWLGRILKGKLKKGFISLQHLQTGTNTGDTSDESNAERLTKMDSKLMATDQLLVTARRLDSAGRLIQDFIDYACSNKASISGIKRKSQQLKRGVVPMIIKASSTLEGIGTILAPAAGTKYVFNRNECKRKRDVVDESSTLSSDLQLVMNYISETDAQEITPPKKKRTITTRKVTESVSLPEPKSGKYYTKTEVINILSPIDKGSHKLASTMAEMVRLRYVPVKVCALQRMLRKKRGGKAIVDTPWSIGRTGIASPDEMKGFAEFVNKQQGRTFDKSDIRDFLVKTQRDRLTAAGYVPSHLFLMRNTAGAEKEMHKHYHEHILIPGINAQRKKYHDFDIDAGSPVPKDLHAVTWCDGALSQIAATKCNAELFRENEITCNKQNAARTAVEQSCDTGTVFRALKASLPSYTVGDGPPGPMKQRILRLFDNLVLKLKPTKKNALVDFLSILSGLATRVCTKSNIQSGFIAAGK